MGLFAILLTIMTKNSIFDVGSDPELVFMLLIFISLVLTNYKKSP